MRMVPVKFSDLKFELTVSTDDVLANVDANIRRGLPQVQPHNEQDQELAIVGGGWSLLDTVDELRTLAGSGVKVVTLNGSHGWCLDNGFRPSAHVQVDARAFNARFVERTHPDCVYLIASQSHPSVFDELERQGRRTLIFHCSGGDEEVELLNKYYFRQWFLVIGGSTVALRAIPLLRMLGYKRFHLFGIDSCLRGDEHHAYPQAENDEHTTAIIEVEDRKFRTTPWMHQQAKEFVGVIKGMGQLFELSIHGDGLLAHILKACAEKLEN